jgi:hypothetical protein
MIWMHEFWLWCDFKSLKIFVKKSLKIIVKKCENLCKGLNLKYVWKVVKNGLWKAFKIVGEICVKIWIWKDVKDLNLKGFEIGLKWIWKKKEKKTKPIYPNHRRPTSSPSSFSFFPRGPD